MKESALVFKDLERLNWDIVPRARDGIHKVSVCACVRVVLICMCFIASADIVYF